MSRFTADENFPGTAVARLRAAGHDLLWVRETNPGARDDAILSDAVLHVRTILTFDKDFEGVDGLNYRKLLSTSR